MRRWEDLTKAANAAKAGPSTAAARNIKKTKALKKSRAAREEEQDDDDAAESPATKRRRQETPEAEAEMAEEGAPSVTQTTRSGRASRPVAR